MIVKVVIHTPSTLTLPVLFLRKPPHVAKIVLTEHQRDAVKFFPVL